VIKQLLLKATKAATLAKELALLTDGIRRVNRVVVQIAESLDLLNDEILRTHRELYRRRVDPAQPRDHAN